MIKKLLIALVALSFIVGNFALADNGNPPDKPLLGDEMMSTGRIVQDPVNLELFKPSDEDCGWQDYMCEYLAYYWAFSATGSYGEIAVRLSPTTTEECRVDAIGFYMLAGSLVGGTDATGDLEVVIYREDPVYDNYPDIFATDGGVLYSFVVANADVNQYGIASTPFTQIDDTYATWPSGGIYFPSDGSDIFVALRPVESTDTWYNWGDDLTTAFGGDCTFASEYRSLLYVNSAGDFYFMYFSAGYWLNLGIVAYTCCEMPIITCPGNQEWPTFGQNYGRTGFSTNTIGDLTNFSKLWEWQGDYYCVWGHPIIADEKVYIAFYDEIVCLDLYTGALIWRTGNADVGYHADYVAFMGNTTNNMRTVPTYDNGYLYFGTGNSSLNEGIVCADALTGDTVWVRHADLGSGLPGGVAGMVGQMQFTVPAIIGDNVYFGTSFGAFYALDKNTGVDVWDVLLDQGVMFSPSSDGTDLFVGTSDALAGTGGTLYKLDATDGSTLYTWAGYDAAGECFETAPVYNADDGGVYVNGGTAVAISTYSRGLLAMVNGADLSPVWGWNLTQYPWYVTPNLIPDPWNRLTCGGAAQANSAWGPWSSGNTTLSSTRQYSLAGSRVWTGDFHHMTTSGVDRWDISSNQFASSCDYYLFAGYGFETGTWRVMNALTGSVLLQYEFSGNVLGTAIAEYADEDYVVTATFDSQYGNGYGKVLCFKVGADRPRLHIPESVVELASVSFVDAYPQYRSADLFENIGSADLNWTIEIVTAKSAARIADGGFSKIYETATTPLGEFGMEMLNNRTWTNTTDKQVLDNNVSRAAEFVRFTGGLTSLSGVLAAGNVYNQEFELDPDLMARGPNEFEVTIDSDDPDFNPEDDTAYPHADPQATVTVVGVKGYAFCDGYVNFGAAAGNTSYVNNDGWMCDGGSPSDAFSIDGEAGFSYHHSWFYTYEAGNHAWNDESADLIHFEPNSLCNATTFSADIYNAGGLDHTVSGDVFSASFIDSLKDYYGDFDPAATIGMEMFVKEYGGHDDLFYNFKYIYVELQNRGSDPIPADLYWGVWSDWDVADYGENIGVGMIGSGASAYRMFDQTAPEYQYGAGFVPMAGNLFIGGAPTTGAYGTYQIANDPFVYDGYMTDSLFLLIDDCPAYSDCYYTGTEVGVNPGQDMSAILVADKQFVDGNATIKGGIVIYGFNDATAPAAEITAMMNFANKFAGFGRGDVNDDNVINILDLCVLNCYVAGCGCYPHPFLYLGDVNADGAIDSDDVDYLFNYLFMGGPMPVGDFIVR